MPEGHQVGFGIIRTMSGIRQYCAGTKTDGQRCTKWWHKDKHPTKRFCEDHRNQSRQRAGSRALSSGASTRSLDFRPAPGRPKVARKAPPPSKAHRTPAGASLPSPSPPPVRTVATGVRETTVNKAKYARAADPSHINTNFRTNGFDSGGSYERPGDSPRHDPSPRRRWRQGRWLATARLRAASNRGTARERVKHSLVTDRLAIDTDLVTYAFDRNGFYERLADRLLDSLPLHRRLRRGHWLCRCLNDLARGVDPDTYAAQVQKPTRDGLLALGFPKFIATVLGASTGVVLKIALGHTPVGHLTSALRVMIALVCPNLNRCPTKHDVMKTFATPMIGDYLKEMAGESPTNTIAAGRA